MDGLSMSFAICSNPTAYTYAHNGDADRCWSRWLLLPLPLGSAVVVSVVVIVLLLLDDAYYLPDYKAQYFERTNDSGPSPSIPQFHVPPLHQAHHQAPRRGWVKIPVVRPSSSSAVVRYLSQHSVSTWGGLGRPGVAYFSLQRMRLR